MSKVERRPFARTRFRPDAPAVTVDDALDGCQADARAGKLGGGVQALECAKHLVGIRHVETRAIVTNKEHIAQRRVHARRERRHMLVAN